MYTDFPFRVLKNIFWVVQKYIKTIPGKELRSKMYFFVGDLNFCPEKNCSLS